MSYADTHPLEQSRADQVAEDAVIGCVLFDNANALRDVDTVGLKAEHFWSEGHRRIWRAIEAMRARQGDEGIDELTLSAELHQFGTPAFMASITQLGRLTASGALATNAVYYARIVRNRAMLRDATDKTRRLQHDLARDPGADDAAAVQALTDARDELDRLTVQAAGLGSVRTLSSCLREGIDHIHAVTRGDAHVSISTGIKGLDKALGGGLPVGKVTIAAGRPGHGKTVLGCQLALNVGLRNAREGRAFRRVLVLSMEMLGREVSYRMWGSDGGFHWRSLIDPEPGAPREAWAAHNAAWEAAIPSVKRVDPAPVLIDDASTMTPSYIRRVVMAQHWQAGEDARRAAVDYEGGLDLVVVDYAQIITPERQGDSEVEMLAQISKALTALAKTTGVAVLLLAQLNRESERLGLSARSSGIKGAGQFEQDAALIMLLRPRDQNDPDDFEVPAGRMSIAITKNREGQTGRTMLGYAPHCSWLGDPWQMEDGVRLPLYPDTAPAPAPVAAPPRAAAPAPRQPARVSSPSHPIPSPTQPIHTTRGGSIPESPF